MSRGLQIGVVGAGRVGHAIAGAFAEAGARVAVYDPDPDRLSVVPYRVALELDAGGADPAAADNVVPVASLAAAAAADLVFEAAPEDLALKRALCGTLGMQAPAAAIIATVTTDLSLAEVAVASPRPDRLLGVHWPPPRTAGGPVEVIEAEMTDPAAADRVAVLLEAMGRSVARVGRGRPAGQSLGSTPKCSPASQRTVSSTSAKRHPSAVRTDLQS